MLLSVCYPILFYFSEVIYYINMHCVTNISVYNKPDSKLTVFTSCRIIICGFAVNTQCYGLQVCLTCLNGWLLDSEPISLKYFSCIVRCNWVSAIAITVTVSKIRQSTAILSIEFSWSISTRGVLWC